MNTDTPGWRRQQALARQARPQPAATGINDGPSQYQREARALYNHKNPARPPAMIREALLIIKKHRRKRKRKPDPMPI